MISSDTAIRELALTLGTLPQLNSLDLSFNSFTAQSLAPFAVSLSSPTSSRLKVLRLRGNPCGDEGAKLISGLLGTGLIDLDISLLNAHT